MPRLHRRHHPLLRSARPTSIAYLGGAGAAVCGGVVGTGKGAFASVLSIMHTPPRILFKKVRDKAAGVAGDRCCVFSDTNARRLAGNHPGADDWIAAVERWHFDMPLIDETFRAVAAAGLGDR